MPPRSVEGVKKLIPWFTETVGNWKIPMLVTVFWLIPLFYSLFISIALLASHKIIPALTTEVIGLDISLKLSKILVREATIEEFWFRLLPLSLAVVVWGKSFWVYAAATVSSVIFGYIHGGVINIFLTQGVIGFSWCVLFLKCGGFQKKFLTAYLCAIMAHFLFNQTLFALFIIFKEAPLVL